MGRFIQNLSGFLRSLSLRTGVFLVATIALLGGGLAYADEVVVDGGNPGSSTVADPTPEDTGYDENGQTQNPQTPQNPGDPTPEDTGYESGDPTPEDTGYDEDKYAVSKMGECSKQTEERLSGLS